MEKYNKITDTVPRLLRAVGMPPIWARILGHLVILATAASAPLLGSWGIDLSQLADVLQNL
jgi:hypothetical protein